MARPAIDPAEWASTANYPSRVYPATLPDGSAHPEAGNATPWSTGVRRTTVGLAAAVAAGFEPGNTDPRAAQHVNEWLNEVWAWVDHSRRELEASIDMDLTALDADSDPLELLTHTSLTAKAILGYPIDDLYLTSGAGSAAMDSTGTTDITDLAQVAFTSGEYRLTGDLIVSDLDIGANTIVNCQGNKLIVTGHLTVADGVEIYARDPSFGTSYLSASNTTGAGGEAGLGSASDTSDRDGEDVPISLGGAGGDGGEGTSSPFTFGIGGTATPPSATGANGRMSTLTELLKGHLMNGQLVNGGGGGGGGIGTFDSNGFSGRGGRGGGVCIVAAYRITLAASATVVIHADGEDGQDATDSGGAVEAQGGGGGGGGGLAIRIARFVELNGGTLTVRAAGGTAGVGILSPDVAATDGADGTVITVDL